MSIKPPTEYQGGEDRYIHFAEDFLGVNPVGLQNRILRTVANNQFTLIWGANGPGKSFITAALKLGFLYSNEDSIVMGTSGSYQQYYDTMWRPLENMHKHAKREYGLPGRTLGGQGGSRLEIDSEWYAKTISPRSPGELEGRHGSDVLVVIDEADKKFVTEEHFDSAGSSITDLNDKIVALCNPPEDETNVVYKKKQSKRWEVVEFSSFEAHNVQVDAGLIDEEPVPGIVDLITLAGDWEAWNGINWPTVDETYAGQWPGMPAIQDLLEADKIERERVIGWLRPGFEKARTAHERRSDLDSRWYMRRAGMIPPDSASAHRPIYRDMVRGSNVDAIDWDIERYGIGVDIGRTVDSTAVIEVRDIDGADTRGLYVRTDAGGERTHGDNESMCRASFEDGPMFGTAAVDATGEGSGVADQMCVEYDFAERFSSGKKPASARQQKEFKDRRTEALFLLGQFLENGGVFCHDRLEKELFASARHIQFTRARSGGEDVLKATSKEQLQKEMGRSPDMLDAAAIAVWCAEGAHEQTFRNMEGRSRRKISSTW